MSNPTYRVRFENSVFKQLRKIDPQNQTRILKAAKLLGSNPIPPAAKKLSGYEGLWRIRVGDYRIIYSILDEELVVLVVQVGHRRNVYKL